MTLPPLVALVGTTASGKSDLGIELAGRLGGVEIVSADSRQVYRGLDIGSGKVPHSERRGVPHHLLDVADLHAPRFTVAEYQRLALAAVGGIHARDKLPLVVGGTGLYVQALVDNPRFPPVPTDTALRTELEARPLPELVERLRLVDPEGAARIDLANPRRVVRALEVSILTGVPYSRQRSRAHPVFRVLQLGLTWPATELRRRIEERLDERLEAKPGLLEEVQGLLRIGVASNRLLELGLEYRFVTRHLQGELSFPDMRRLLATAIYQFSRRQLTWFRRDQRIHWLDTGADFLAEAEAVTLTFLSGGSPGH